MSAAQTPASHPSTFRPGRLAEVKQTKRKVEIPTGVTEAVVEADGKPVKLTNLNKLFWINDGITKGDLLRYYATVAPVLLPHIQGRAMVLKRYPGGAEGEFFFQKHAPKQRPDWLSHCEILHPSANLVGFPVINDAADMLWAVNLGCIDLNPWYARCDDVDRPDYLHFDLDPTPGADFALVRRAALLIRDELGALGMKTYPKTTGSRGMHVYVPIQRGPTQKQVWTFAKAFALTVADKYKDVLASEYRIAKRAPNRVLVDYNQNAWGRTLASVYSARPKPRATVSAPVTWDEVEAGIVIEDFRIDNMPQRLAAVGDLYKPLLLQKGRTDLVKFL